LDGTPTGFHEPCLSKESWVDDRTILEPIERSDIYDAKLGRKRIPEPYLRQPPHKRHLPPLESNLQKPPGMASLLALVTTTRGFAETRSFSPSLSFFSSYCSGGRTEPAQEGNLVDCILGHNRLLRA